MDHPLITPHSLCLKSEWAFMLLNTEPALGAGHTDGGILQPTAPQWFETTLIKGRTDY